MQAAILNQYHKHDVALSITDVPMPTINADQVLVKSLAAGVNPVDNMITRGEVKLIIPYQLPIVAGNEIVGEIVALGANVSGFKKAIGSLPACRSNIPARLPSSSQSTATRLPKFPPTFPMKKQLPFH